MSDAKATVTTGLLGKGKLTAVGMKKWFQYNRNAIVKNAPDVEATRKAIWGIYYHSVSTSEDSHLSHCDLEWCFYLQVTTEGAEPEQKWKEGKHGQPLPRDAFDIWFYSLRA